MGRRRMVRWAIVVGLAVAIGLVLAALILQQPGRGADTASAVPAELAKGASARQAFTAAQEVALTWQEDARPGIVSGQWRLVYGRSSRVAWGFQFYSASTQRLAVITVQDEQAHLLRDVLSPYPLVTFDEADWRVDSPAALETWWKAGGATFIARHREVEIIAQLRPMEEIDGALGWAVTGVAGDQVWNVIVDGETGEKVER